MKVSVFGASGFIGINTVKALLDSGFDVVSSDIRNHPDNESEFIKADILNQEEIQKVVNDSDIIVHLAASPLPYSLKEPLKNAEINILGSLNIMDVARRCGCEKIVFSSASSIVGNVIDNPVTELHPCKPKTPYGVAKYAIENYLRVYNEIYSLNYLIFRFFNVYGPYQYPDSGALIPQIHSKIKNNQEITVFGDGSQTRDFIYVEDLSQFIVKAAKSPVKNEIINMGTGIPHSVMDIIQESSKILSSQPLINYQPERPGEISNFVADTTKIFNLFNEIPDTPLQEGLKKTYSWLNNCI